MAHQLFSFLAFLASWRLTTKPREVIEDQQARGAAFFGVELRGVDVFLHQRCAEGAAVVDGGGGDLEVFRYAVEAVDAVDAGTFGHAFEERGLTREMEGVPAHVRDL